MSNATRSTDTTTASHRSVSLPSAPVLIGAAYAVCVLGLIAIFCAQILFTDVDAHADEGPIASIIGVGVLGTAVLLIGVGASLWLVRTPERASVGAVVFAALSVLSLVVFWSGAPAILGACTAWLAGLTRGSRPLGGAARTAGIVGVCVVVLGMVLTVGGVLISLGD
jgi:hypothetical protein